MTMQSSDERLDTALREFLNARAREIEAAALPAHEVSARLADQHSWRDRWRDTIMSNTLKFATAGAAALAVGVGIGLYLGQLGGLEPPASSPSPEPTPTSAQTASPTPAAGLSPVEIAEAYIEAINAYDVERARELVSQDFATTEYPDGHINVQTMELAFDSARAYGLHYSDVDCGQDKATPERVERVRCDFLWAMELQRIGSHEPTQKTFRFTIEGGRIKGVLMSHRSIASWWDPWLGFLRAEHPDFYRVVTLNFNPTAESMRELVEQMPRYLDLYGEWLNRASPTVPPLPAQGILEPGTYLAGGFPFRAALTVPEGYEALDGWAVVKHADTPLGVLFVGIWEPGAVSRVYADPCKWSAGPLVDPGPTADDFVSALMAQPGRNPTEPAPVTVAGYQGVRIQVEAPTDLAFELPSNGGDGAFPECDAGEYRSWLGYRGQGPGQVDDLWVLDVEGMRLVIGAHYWQDTPADEVAELVGIVESIESLEIAGR
jgi:hypothetical protein